MVSPIWVILSLMASLSPKSQIVQLPRVCLPEHYDLKFDFSNPDELIPGMKDSVQIRINCVADTNNLTLNWKRLFISEENISVTTFDEKTPKISGSNIRILKVYYQSEKDFLTMTFAQNLKKGSRYTVAVNFSKLMRMESTGLYKNFYYDPVQESTNWIVLTYLYPMNARLLFPCYDEPDLKATFNLTLIYSSFYNAISNLERIEDECDESISPTSVCQKFSSKSPIAPYELAFSINDYSTIKRAYLYDPIIKGLTNTNIEELNAAVNYSSTLLERFSDLLGVEYPVDKLTLITVVATSWEFSGGIGLLGVPSTIEDEHKMSLHLARALLRHIFTELLPLKSWADLWIAEGLTWYFSLEVLEERNTDNSNRCLDLSGYSTVNSLLDFQENSTIVDVLSLNELGQKAYCMFNTLSNYIGRSNFLQGTKCLMKNYINTSMGIEALSASFKSNQIQTKDLKSFFESWLLTTETPIVNITRSPNSTKQYQMSIFNQSKNCRSLRVFFNEASFLLNCREPTVGNSTSIPTNFEDFYQYKILYDNETYNLIAKQLSGPNNISAYSRARLLNDVLDFAWNGSVNYTTALNLVTFLRNETEFSPWQVAFYHFERIWYLLQDDNRTNDFNQFLRTLITPLYKKAGLKNFEKLSKDTQQLHSMLAHWACRLNLDNWPTVIRNIFGDERNVPETLMYDVLSEVSANRSNWNIPPGINQNVSMAQKELSIVNALKAAKPHELMALILSPIAQNHFDANFILNELVLSNTSTDVLLALIGKGNEELKRKIVRSLAGQITTMEDYDILLKMTNRLKDVIDNGSVYKEVTEIVRLNLKWFENRSDDFFVSIKSYRA